MQNWIRARGTFFISLVDFNNEEDQKKLETDQDKLDKYDRKPNITFGKGYESKLKERE